MSIQGLCDICWLQLFIFLLLIKHMIKVSFALASGIIQDAANMSLREPNVLEISLFVVTDWSLRNWKWYIWVTKTGYCPDYWKISLEKVNLQLNNAKKHITNNRIDLVIWVSLYKLTNYAYVLWRTASWVGLYRIEKRKEEREGGALVLSHTHQKETGLSNREKERNLRRAEADRDKNICLASTWLPGLGPPLRDMVLVCV